jgi:hypothetical protein
MKTCQLDHVPVGSILSHPNRPIKLLVCSTEDIYRLDQIPPYIYLVAVEPKDSSDYGHIFKYKPDTIVEITGEEVFGDYVRNTGRIISRIPGLGKDEVSR